MRILEFANANPNRPTQDEKKAASEIPDAALTNAIFRFV
jgi:hypothetical protein